MKNKKEIECECFGHRLYLEREDGVYLIAIAERKRGRPKWHEVVIHDEKKVKQLKKFFK